MIRRVIAALLLAGTLASCTLPLVTASSLDRADRAFARLEDAAELVLPTLPASQAVRVRAILATIAIGLDTVRTAGSIDERDAAIARVNSQLPALKRAIGR